MITTRPPYLRRLRGVRTSPDVTTPPPGVLAAGLSAVWLSKATAGLKLATNKTMPADAASLPFGASYDAVTPGQHYVLFDEDASVSQWDFTGFEVYADSAIVTLTNCILAYQGGPHCATVRNAATMNLVSCNWDATNLTQVGGLGSHGSTNVPPGCTMNWTDVKAWGAARSYADCTGTFSTTQSYMQCFGINTDSFDHSESVKVDNGTRVISYCIIDSTDGGMLTGPLTAPAEFYNADSTGNITVTIDHSIINWPDYMNAPYTFQDGVNVPNTVTITITNCAIKKGTTAYFTNSANCTIIDGGGNYDLVTGALITSFT